MRASGKSQAAKWVLLMGLVLAATVLVRMMGLFLLTALACSEPRWAIAVHGGAPAPTPPR